MQRDSGLLERAGELEQLGALVDAASDGHGGLLIVQGEAGIGKTRLLGAARELAAGRGLTVLSGRGGELERDFGYGVVRQLFEAHLRSLPESERAALLAGAAAPAASVLGFGEQAPAPTADASVIAEHGLYWVTVDLATQGPVLLCVDDAHWSDLASLRWLVYLARRLEGLAVGVVVGWRQGEPGAPEDLLAALGDQPQAEAITPGALSAEASATIVRGALTRAADDRFCAACWQVSGGNPFLLGELVRALEAEGIAPTADSAERVLALGPTAVARSVLVRLSRLPPAATALARAVAVLENDVDLRHAALLAQIEDGEAADSMRALAAAHIVEPSGSPRFAHPILRTAVYRDLGEAERAALHRTAARLLDEQGHADRAAVHLLSADPAGDPWASKRLCDAGRRALRRGAPDTAVALLRRALEEPPPAAERSTALLDLGRAERFAGDPHAIEHLQHALDLSAAPAQRADSARELTSALLYASRGEEAIEMLEEVIAGLPKDERELRYELEVELAALGVSVVSATPRLAKRLAALAGEATEATPAERSLLAAFALYGAMGGSSADEVSTIAERAWSDGQLLRDNPAEQAPVAYAAIGLRMVERLDSARTICDQAVAATRELGSVTALALALANRAYVAWAQGDPRTGEADAREAVHLASLAGIDLIRIYALALLVLALNQTGALEQAEAALAEHGFLDRDPPAHIQTSVLLPARAELRLEQGRREDAVRDADQSVRWHRAQGLGTPGNGIRALGLALLAEGDSAQAREIVDARLSKAREKGLNGNAAEMLATLGLIEGGREGLELLEQATVLAAGSPRRLIEAQVLLDYGAALRRAKRRKDAREPLRRALDIAHDCGGGLIEGRAHQELLACGARPRRLVLSGADALTASERRIAGMAAEGNTNREIAQALFVTPKTVESHLRSIFRKLDVASRTEIAAALTASRPTRATPPEAPSPDSTSAVLADDDAALTTILFTDIVRSTEKASQLGPARWRALLDRHDALVRAELERFRGREVKNLGDGFLATFDSPTRAVRCACAIRTGLNGLGLQLRAGIHTGECSYANGDLRGLAVHVAARLVDTAPPGQVLVSESVCSLVANPTLQFSDEGTHTLEGISGEWALHAAHEVADAQA